LKSINKKGFTIVEILVVIVIIGLILAVAIPSVITISNRMKSIQLDSKITLATSAAIVWARENENCFFHTDLRCTGRDCGFECPPNDNALINFECTEINCPECDRDTKICHITLKALADAKLIDRDSNGRILDPVTGEDMSRERVPIVYNRENFSRIALDLDRQPPTTTPPPTTPPPPPPALLRTASVGGIEENSRFLSTAPNALLRNQIESIQIVTHNNVPSDALGFYDVSDPSVPPNSVMLWWYPGSTSGLFRVFIGGNGKVIANPNSSSLFRSVINATSITLNNFDTSRVRDMSQMFGSAGTTGGWSANWFNCNRRNSLVKSLDLSGFDTSNVTNMRGMFQCMPELEQLNISNFDTSRVTDMSLMFFGATKLTDLNVSHFNTANVTNMSAMFHGQGNTTLDISNFNMSRVTNISRMFLAAINLSTIITDGGVNTFNWDTSRMTSFERTFSSTRVPSLTFGPNFVSTNVTTMESMFTQSTNLATITTPAGVNVINWNTSRVTTMQAMFSNVPLTSIEFGPNFVTNNVTNMHSMFMGTRSLTRLATPAGVNVINWDTRNVNMFASMFSGTGLSNIEFGPNFVTTNATSFAHMFNTTPNLTRITTPAGENVFNWDTRNLRLLWCMFEGSRLPSLRFGPNFVTHNVVNMWMTFHEMRSLTELDIRHFNFNAVTDHSSTFGGIPSSARIIVNANGAAWIRQRWPHMSNLVIQ